MPCLHPYATRVPLHGRCSGPMPLQFKGTTPGGHCPMGRRVRLNSAPAADGVNLIACDASTNLEPVREISFAFIPPNAVLSSQRLDDSEPA